MGCGPCTSAAREVQAKLRFRRAVFGILLATGFFVSLESLWVALSPLGLDVQVGLPGQRVIGLFPVFLVLIETVVLARLGQDGSKAAVTVETPPTSAVTAGDRTQDRYWMLGLFYFNRADPAVFVEKRFGLGYTMNFASPASWIIVSRSGGSALRDPPAQLISSASRARSEPLENAANQ
jgi:uncharacterized membrane protein